MILQRLLGRYADAIYAALRMVAGALLACHGLQKLFGFWTTSQPTVLSQLWVGGVIELGCGTLVALGLLTSWAAFLASGTMAVAYLQFHWKGQLGAAFFPLVNKGELAVAYAFLFLYFAAKGAGPASVDALLRRRAPSR